ncbi:putative aminophospholipid transporter [Plasmodium gaboni]|uniref:Putative aminophospholipid transporter n=1 Tax=Plasmodium gaboni TaxID=647221 RepID=A0A151LBE6_9APIC|nr:putative aminophospholipid transporter [Plasmodium gaboni]KYN96271.1 putative aminophospholipid transporter [Plasmodium gaboni]
MMLNNNLKTLALNIPRDKEIKYYNFFIRKVEGLLFYIKKRIINITCYLKSFTCKKRYPFDDDLYDYEEKVEKGNNVYVYALLYPIINSLYNIINLLYAISFKYILCLFFNAIRKKKRNKLNDNIIRIKLERNKTILKNYDRCIFLTNDINNCICHKQIIEICKNFINNVIYHVHNLEFVNNDREKIYKCLKNCKNINRMKEMFIKKIKHLYNFDFENALYLSDESLIKKKLHFKNTYESNHFTFYKNKEKKGKSERKLDLIKIYDELYLHTYIIRNNLNIKSRMNIINNMYNRNILSIFINIFFKNCTNIIFIIFLIACIFQQISIIKTSHYLYFLQTFYFIFICCIIRDMCIVNKKTEHMKQIKRKTYKRLTPLGLIDVLYCDIKVGDILYLPQFEVIPADIILLKNCTDDDILISSKNYDGYKDLKIKKCVKITNILANIYDIFLMKIKVLIEKPHCHFDRMKGLLFLLNCSEVTNTIVNDITNLEDIYFGKSNVYNISNKNINKDNISICQFIFIYIIQDTYVELSYNFLKYLFARSIHCSYNTMQENKTKKVLSPCEFLLNNKKDILSRQVDNNNINSSYYKRNEKSIHYSSDSCSYSSDVYLCMNKIDTYPIFCRSNDENINSKNDVIIKPYKNNNNIETNKSDYTSEMYNNRFPTYYDDIFNLKEKLNHKLFRKYKESINIDNIIWDECTLIKSSIYGLVIYTGIDKKSNIINQNNKKKIKEKKKNDILFCNDMNYKMKILLLTVICINCILCINEENLLDQNIFLIYIKYFFLLLIHLPNINCCYIFIIHKLYSLILWNNNKLINTNKNKSRYTNEYIKNHHFNNNIIYNYNIIKSLYNTQYILYDKIGTLSKDNHLKIHKFDFIFDEFLIDTHSTLFFQTFFKVVDFKIFFHYYINDNNNNNNNNNYNNNNKEEEINKMILHNIHKYHDSYDIIKDNSKVYKNIFHKIINYSCSEIHKIFLTFLCILFCNDIIIRKMKRLKIEEKIKERNIYNIKDKHIYNIKENKDTIKHKILFSTKEEETLFLNFLRFLGMQLYYQNNYIFLLCIKNNISIKKCGHISQEKEKKRNRKKNIILNKQVNNKVKHRNIDLQQIYGFQKNKNCDKKWSVKKNIFFSNSLKKDHIFNYSYAESQRNIKIIKKNKGIKSKHLDKTHDHLRNNHQNEYNSTSQSDNCCSDYDDDDYDYTSNNWSDSDSDSNSDTSGCSHFKGIERNHHNYTYCNNKRALKKKIYENEYKKKQTECPFKILDIFQSRQPYKLISILMLYNNQIYYLLKTYDEYTIYMLCNQESKENKKDQIIKSIQNLLKNGFGILLFAYKIVPNNEYEIYKKNCTKENKKNYFENVFIKNVIILGIFSFKEEIKNSAKKIINLFKEADIKTWILSSDKKRNVLSICKSLNLINERNTTCYLNKNKLIRIYKKYNTVINTTTNNDNNNNKKNNNMSFNSYDNEKVVENYINTSSEHKITSIVACNEKCSNDTSLILNSTDVKSEHMNSTLLLSNNIRNLSKDMAYYYKNLNTNKTNKCPDLLNNNDICKKKNIDDKMVQMEPENIETSLLNNNYNIFNKYTHIHRNISRYIIMRGKDSNDARKELDISYILKTDKKACYILKCMLFYNFDENYKSISQVHNNYSKEKMNNDIIKLNDIKNIVYIISGDILEYYLKYDEINFISVLKNCKLVIFYKCNCIVKGKIVRALKKYSKDNICSVGNNIKDINMFKESDISIFINNNNNNNNSFNSDNVCKLYADIVLKNFGELGNFFFIYGKKIYVNFILLIKCIYYRGISLFFLQFYFSYFFKCKICIFSNTFLFIYFVLFFVMTSICIICSIKCNDKYDNIIYDSKNVLKKKKFLFKKLLKIDNFTIIYFYKTLFFCLNESCLIFILSYYYFLNINYEINTLTTLFITHIFKSLFLYIDTYNYFIIFIIIHLLFAILYIFILFILHKFHFIYFNINLDIIQSNLIVNTIINFPSCMYYLYKKKKFKNMKKKFILNTIKSFDSFKLTSHHIFHIHNFNLSFDTIPFAIKPKKQE